MIIRKIRLLLSKYNNSSSILKKYLKILYRFNKNIFTIFLIVYLTFLILEQIWGNKIKEYIDLNNTLIFLIISGIILSFSIEKDKAAPKKHELKAKDIVLIIVLGVIGSYLIWLRIKEWQIISYFISISLGIFIIIFLYLFLKNE